MDYPADRLEILLARGRQPSVQRNTAMRAARGEIIYFLDDDSIPPPGNLRRALELFKSPAVRMVGGPSLCPPEAPALNRTFALAMGSWLAFGPSAPVTAPAAASGPPARKRLILCNLLARREDLLQLGGFNEALYPNEENALMDEIAEARRHAPLRSAPGGPPPAASDHPCFCKMLLNYGRGRAEQFRSASHFPVRPNFIPSDT